MKVDMILNFKSQVDNSPVVSSNPNKENQELIENKEQNQEIIPVNLSVLKEFSDIIPSTYRNFSEMNDIVSTTNRSLLEFKRILLTDNGNNSERISYITRENKPTQGLLDNKIQVPEENNNGYNNSFPEIENQNRIENEQRFSETQEDYSDELKDSTNSISDLSDFLPELLKNFRAMNDIINKTTQNLPAIGHVKTSEEQKKNLLENYHRQNFMQIVNGGSNAVQSLASGNIGGGLLSGVNTVSNLANNTSKIAGAAEMTGLAKGLMVGGVAALAAGAVVKGVDTLANKYIEEMPTMYNAGRAFGSTSDNKSMISYLKLNEYNKGTGLENDAFVSLASSLRQQGVANDEKDSYKQLDIVGKIAETTSRWAYATGGNAEQYANLAGLMSRYGGSKDVESDFNYLVSAGKASGLNNTQIPEFLSGIQKVMEDGISKGFTRSATEVADTLVMMSKLSGNNEFFKGEQGAKIINQVNSGISRATALNSSEDILVYSAFDKAYSPEKQKEILDKQGSYVEGAEYVNTMQMIERGLNASNINILMDYIDNHYGSEDDKIEAIRSMTGLNYNGSSLFYNTVKKAQNEEVTLSDEDIEKITKAPENVNNETNYKQALNDIKSSVVSMSEKLGELKIKGMSEIAGDVKKIANKVTGADKRIVQETVIENNKKREEEGKKTVKELSELQKSELVESGVYKIKDPIERQAAINSYIDWNGIGMPENWNQNRIYSDYSKGELKLKTGGWQTRDNYDYTNSTYGNFILGLTNENEEQAKAFMNALIYKDTSSKAHKKFYNEADKYRDSMNKETKNKQVTEDEKSGSEKILKMLYDKFVETFGNGITVNEVSN